MGNLGPVCRSRCLCVAALHSALLFAYAARMSATGDATGHWLCNRGWKISSPGRGKNKLIFIHYN